MFTVCCVDLPFVALASPPGLIGHVVPPSPVGTHQARYIGDCKMEADGTIRMFLRAETQTGGGRIVGHVMQEYRPGDRQYEEILEHVGPMRPGDRRPVPAWPD